MFIKKRKKTFNPLLWLSFFCAHSMAWAQDPQKEHEAPIPDAVLPVTFGEAKNQNTWSVQESKKLTLQAQAQLADAFTEDHAQIVELFQRALTLNPANIDAHAGLARYHIWLMGLGDTDMGDVYRATQYAQQVHDLAPQRPLGQLLLAEILWVMGQPEQALKIAESVEVRFPQHLDVLVFQARVFAKTDFQRALKASLIALAQGAHPDELSPSLAAALGGLHPNGGVALARALGRLADFNHDRWLHHRAAMAYLAAMPEKEGLKWARPHFKRAIELGNRVESRLQWALAEQKAGAHSESYQAFKQLIHELQVNHPRATGALALAHAHAALALADQQGPLTTATAQNPKITQAMGYHLAHVTEAKDRLEDHFVGLAEELQSRGWGHVLSRFVQDALESDPSWVQGYAVQGHVRFMEKNFHAARESFAHALLLKPKNDAYYAARAHASHGLGDFQAALDDFAKSVSLNPNVPAYHYNQACMQARLGLKNEAIMSLKVAVAMNEDYKNLAEKDEDLEPLRQDEALKPQLVGLGILTAQSLSNREDTSAAP